MTPDFDFFTFSNSLEVDVLMGTKSEWEAFLQNKYEIKAPSQPGHKRAWPSPYKGSLSHCQIDHDLSIFLVAAGKSSDLLSVGVDVEVLMSKEVALEVRDLVGDRKELNLLQTILKFNEEFCVSLLFSAKETIYKLLNPLTNKFLDFSDATLTKVEMAQGSITLNFNIPKGENFLELQVRCLVKSVSIPNRFDGHLILTLAKL